MNRICYSVRSFHQLRALEEIVLYVRLTSLLKSIVSLGVPRTTLSLDNSLEASKELTVNSLLQRKKKQIKIKDRVQVESNCSVYSHPLSLESWTVLTP